MARHFTTHRQDKATRKLLYIGVGIVFLIIFMAVFGLNFLINASLFLGNAISGKKTQAVETKADFYGTLFLDDVIPATNSAEMYISGTSSNFNKVTFYINDENVKETDVTNDDSFSEKIGDLKPGDNEVYVEAYDSKSKSKKKSDTFTVVYKNEKPKLEVSEPANDSTSNKEEISIKGTTDKDVTIEVDGSPAVVGGTGNFQTTTRLKEGDNTLVIVAMDDAGNESKIELKVKYQKE